MPAPIKLLDSTTVSASGAGSAITDLQRYLGIFGIINVSAVPTGGTPTLDVYVQASPDGGTTWRDVAHFQFGGSVAVRMFQLSQIASPGTATLAASDAAIADNTSVQGPFGDRLRVKYVFAAGGSTGTYTLSVSGQPVGGP